MSDYLQIYDSNHAMDATAWKLYLAEQAAMGQPVAFLVDCDRTLQLTPQQVSLFLGTNSVWNDIGLTELTYITPNKRHTLLSDRKYFTNINGTKSIVNGSGQEIIAVTGRDNVTDLTKMFGSEIANYIYELGSVNGVAKLNSWGYFIKDHYEYNFSLQSVNVSAHITRDANNNIIGNYSLDSTKEFRGIFKLDANNNLYADGDVYEPSGGITRNFGIRAYQSGDESLADAITDGTNTVYKLSTPITETADPFTAIQDVSPYGTEEYVDYGVSQGTRDIAVPVGHQTRYIKRVPIEGKTQIKTYVSPTNSVEDATVYTTNLNGIKYGGTLDVISGKLDKTHEGITYTGQTINEPWLSNCDEYSQGTTPTYGAIVVYELTTPTRVSLTAQAVAMLDGTNVVWADADSVEVKYGFEPGILYNPTRFDAQPLLLIDGYGVVEFNGYEIEITDEQMGNILIASGDIFEDTQIAGANTLTYDLSRIAFNEGDIITIKPFSAVFSYIGNYSTSEEIYRYELSENASSVVEDGVSGTRYFQDNYVFCRIQTTIGRFEIDTSHDATVSHTADVTITVTKPEVDPSFSANTVLECGIYVTYNATTRTLTVQKNGSNEQQYVLYKPGQDYPCTLGDVSVYSTISVRGNPVYIDCELGEAYKFVNGEAVSLNKYIDLGSDLPSLAPGLNEITASEYVTGLRLRPRWWKI